MPRIKQNMVLNFATNLKAFLRLDAGVGRSLPDNPEDVLQQRGQRIKHLQQELENQKGKPGRGSDRPAPLEKQLQREKERRQRAESALVKQQRKPSDSEEVVENAHALPEPEEPVDRRQIFQSLISSFKPGRMLELGAGHGRFSIAAAELGWNVRAVDARTILTPRPENTKDPKRAEIIRSIEWVQSDVREYRVNSEEYDLICILGLIHHLEVEDQPKLLEQCSDTLTLLDVRIAPRIAVTEGPYEGMYIREPGKTREERDQIAAASWGNETAFRHTEESFIRMARNCGYSKVMPMRPPHDPNYTFYLCLPSN